MEKHIPTQKYRVRRGNSQFHEIRTLHTRLNAKYNPICVYGQSPELPPKTYHSETSSQSKIPRNSRKKWDEIVRKIDIETDPGKFFFSNLSKDFKEITNENDFISTLKEKKSMNPTTRRLYREH